MRCRFPLDHEHASLLHQRHLVSPLECGDRVTPTTTELNTAAAATTSSCSGAPPQTTIRHRRPPPDDRVAGAEPAAPRHLYRPPTHSAQYGWRVRRPTPRITTNSVPLPRESWRAPAGPTPLRAGPTPLRAPKTPTRTRTPRSPASPPHRSWRQTRRRAQRPPAPPTRSRLGTQPAEDVADDRREELHVG